MDELKLLIDIIMYLFYYRLKSLINQADVMVFMKGNKQAARCGFSSQLLQILNQTG